MKEVCLKLFVTNVQELITGLDLIKDVDLGFSGSDLLAGEAIKSCVLPRNFKKVAYTADLDDMFVDPIILDDPNCNLLVQGKDGIIFIGNSDMIAEFAKFIKVGKFGLAAAPNDVNGFPRGFWTSDDKSLFMDVLSYLDPEKPEDKPAEDKPAEEKPAEDKPAEEKPADADKPAEDKPADEKPAKKGAAKKGAAKKGGKPKGDKPAENASPVCCDSLEALFVRKVVNGDNGCEGCGAEETAEQTAQRLCAEEGIEYDADADIAGHK